MLAVQPLSFDSRDKKLRAIGVGTGIGHGQDSRFGMLECKRLILKFTAVDAFSTSSIADHQSQMQNELRMGTHRHNVWSRDFVQIFKVPPLQHKILDYPADIFQKRSCEMISKLHAEV